jgi:3-hydroxypropanoate dehydrogenase
MAGSISQEALGQLFVDARSYSGWQDKPLSDETLIRLYELMKWGPTSANCSPARIVFVKGAEAKERLIACLAPLNVNKVKAAPVTAIVAQDEKFYDLLPKLSPQVDYRSYFASNKALAEATAFRNSSLQGAYLILAARALGLDTGPMSGFDNKKLDEEFFHETSWKSNFICNLGYGDRASLYPRSPRLAFDEACKII